MHSKIIEEAVRLALKEDGAEADITTRALVSPKQEGEGRIIAHEDSVICGIDVVREIFRQLDPLCRVRAHCKEGQMIKPDHVVLTLKGPTRAILSGERVALNFLGRLSGIATITHHFVKLTSSCHTDILDTRKTTPGLRALEKMAVHCGGGKNHRFNLSDMVMIKDNHRSAHSRILSIKEAVNVVRQKTNKKIVLEVDTIKQLEEALASHPDVILLDNMSVANMKKAVQMRNRNNKKILLEASGGITFRNVQDIAKTGVERISIGALTHSAQCIDFSMEFTPR